MTTMAPAAARDTLLDERALAALFTPRSVMVVGASEDPSRIGGRPIRYLIEAGYTGRIFPINPKREQVQGLRAYPTVAAVPQDVELAIIVLPADSVVAAIRECAARKVRVAIVFSAGFSEVGEEGRALQKALLDEARKTGMRILGPNCLGVFNASSGFFGTFTQSLDGGVPRNGTLAIASQSGAYGAHVYALAKARGLETRYWAATGNECDLDIGDCLGWMAQQADAKVIVVYIEAVRDGAKFVAGLEAARAAGKPVVVLKVGRSSSGAAAAASHTGALSGEDAVVDAVLAQYGAWRAESTEQLIDIAYACNRGIFPSGKRIGLMTLSGGVGIQMADAVEGAGMEVPAMPPSAQRRITDLVSFAAPVNPIDLTAQVINDGTLVSRALDVVVKEGGYDALVFFLSTMPTIPRLRALLDAVLLEQQPQFQQRLMMLSFIGPEETRRHYESLGYLFFEDVNRGITALAALVHFGASFAAGARSVTAPAHQSEALDRVPLDEHGAKRALAAAGIPSVPESVVATPALAAEAAARFDGKAVLKIVSPDIQHKTEVGGVALDLATPDEVRVAAERMQAEVARRAPHARIEGFLVAPMCPKGVETICGVFTDPAFGPMVMFGLGGIFVEVLRDVVFRRAPFDLAEARSMVRQIKGHGVLAGARGAAPADVEALAQVLSNLSWFAVRNAQRIAEIDINPYVVFDAGQGGVALDALFVPAGA